jgi:hypothetical protein
MGFLVYSLLAEEPPAAPDDRRHPPPDTPGAQIADSAQDEQCSVPYIRAQIVSFGRTDTTQEIRRGPIIYSFEPYTGAVCNTVGF